MYQLVDFVDRSEPVTLDTKGAEVYSRFQADPGTLVIAVVDDDQRPVGLIERNAFFLKMGAEFGRALFAGRTVDFVMGPPHTQPADASVMDFMGGALAHDPAVLLRGFVVVDADGRYLGVGASLSLLEASYVAAKQRIKDLAELTTNLALAEQQAQAASRAKSQFLATMSHEIRTPLNGVLAVAEIIDRKLEQLELRPYLRTIADSGTTLLRLLTDALDLSRVEAGAMTVDPAPVDLEGVIDEVANLWRPQAELKGLEFIVEGDLATCTVMTDAVRLKQVLNNLVGNAMKFTEAGSVTLRCSLTEAEGGQVRLGVEVEDTGVGIAANQIDRIFAPFAKAEEHAGGAGLGLAICRRIVEALGGAITVRSEFGQGSVFSFSLLMPTVCRVEPMVPTAQEIESEGSAHILIVDDNETNRLIASTLLGMFGFTCAEAHHGRQAVERAAVEVFDLILMDIKMPVMGGVEAARAIRARPGPNQSAPILAVTANTDPADIESYLAAGMAGVVGKPLQADGLLSAIIEALNARQPEPVALCA